MSHVIRGRDTIGHMTVILGVAREGQVTIGADSIAIGGDMALTVSTTPKVFALGPELIIGMSGSFRLIDAMRYMPVPPPCEEGTGSHEYLVSCVVPAIKDAVSEADAEDELDESHMLIGHRGSLFLIDCSSLQVVGPPIDGVEAIGVGAPYAIGAALAMLDEGTALDIDIVVLLALATAESRCGGVRGPFHLESLDG